MEIGNKNQVSFELDSSDQNLRNLNFYMGGKLISNEPIYAPTYTVALKRISDLLEKGEFKKAKLESLTLEQCFIKLNKERDTNERQFFKQLVQLDETIDQYTIFVFQSNDLTEFVWSCWDENNCNSEHKVNSIYSTGINTTELSSILNNLAQELNKTLANKK